MADFLPCSFSHEAKRRKTKKDAPTIDPASIASNSPYYDLTAYPARVVLATTSPVPYTYWIFSSAEAAAIHVANSVPSQRQWFFFVEPARPVFAYLDFDRPPSKEMSRDKFFRVAQLGVAYFCLFVDAFYSFCVVDAGVYSGEWWFYSACTDRKLSIHAHSRMAFVSVDALSAVMEKFRAWLAWLNGQGDACVAPLFFTTRGVHAKCTIDYTVYTKRPFRLPLNRKDKEQQNYLLPLQNSASSQVEEILRGFIHPYKDCMPECALPHPNELLRVRSLRPVNIAPSLDALSSCICTFIRQTYATPTWREFGQLMDDPDAVCNALCGNNADRRVYNEVMSIVGYIVERAFLVDIPRMSDFSQRSFVLDVAWEVLHGAGVSRRARLSTYAQHGGIEWESDDSDCPLDDFMLQQAFVSLELRKHAFFHDRPPSLAAFVARKTQHRVCVPPDRADEFRLASPSFLPIPLGQIPLACMHLCLVSPFSVVGPQLPFPSNHSSNIL